jgi:hypothetical protein
VLQSDYSGILRRLLKFPPVEDVHILVSMALRYQEQWHNKARPGPTIPAPAAAARPTGNKSPLHTPALTPGPAPVAKPTGNKSPLHTPTSTSGPAPLLFSRPAPEKSPIRSQDKSPEVKQNDPLMPLRAETAGKSSEGGKGTAGISSVGVGGKGESEEKKVEEKKSEEKKEEEKGKVLARTEGSLVEKCNAALLLLLEQSDE